MLVTIAEVLLVTFKARSLLWVELCPPKDVEVLTPNTLTVNLFKNRVFIDDQVKMRLLGSVLIQCNWHPDKKGKFVHRDRYS